MRDPIVNIAVNAARAAGNIIVRAQEHLDTIKISEKKPCDFVTNIDKQAEQEIIKIVRKAHPQHGFLAEESGQTPGNEYTWIIDPIDGTRNFIHGLPHFAVSIAIQRKNKIEHGVIYDPIRQELFIATRGKGARLNERRIRVAQRTRLEECMLASDVWPGGGTHLDKAMLQALPETTEIRCLGAATLDLAYVACGRLDGFCFTGLKPWDLAAGILLVKEAGGIVCDRDSSDNFLATGNGFAANPKILKLLLKRLRSEQMKNT